MEFLNLVKYLPLFLRLLIDEYKMSFPEINQYPSEKPAWSNGVINSDYFCRGIYCKKFLIKCPVI